jgi:hypothetical protein
VRDLLVANVPHLLGDKSKLSLRSPEEPPSGTAISLFLYQIAENAHYRNQEAATAAIIDLYYMIIPYSDVTGISETPHQIEQQMLSNVLRALHNARLRTPLLSKELVEADNKEINIYLNNLSMEEANRIWSMFRSASYKLCLSYLVTPVRIPSVYEDFGKKIVSEKIEFEELIK